ncbi:hypothetical protein ABZ945_30670, partial [Streptomyces sp. NPDC046887]
GGTTELTLACRDRPGAREAADALLTDIAEAVRPGYRPQRDRPRRGGPEPAAAPPGPRPPVAERPVRG